MGSLQEEFARQGRSLERGAKLTGFGLLNDLTLLTGSPAAEGFERAVPNLVHGLGALAGFERSQELFDATIDRNRELVGSPAPARGFQENAAEFAPGAMIPTPGKLVDLLGKLPGATRFMLEMLLPANQIRSVPAVGAAMALPTGLITGGQALEDLVSEEEKQETPRLTGDIPPEFEVPIAGSNLPNAPVPAFDKRQITTLDEEITDLIPAAAALSVAVGAIAFGARRKIQRGFSKDPNVLTGQTQPRVQTTGVGTKTIEALVDQHAPLIAAHRKAAPTTFDSFLAHLKTTMTPGAMSDRIRAALKMGDLPNTHITIPSPVVHLETFAKMSSAQRVAYDDALVVLNKIDDLDAIGSNVWGTKNNSVTRTVLEARARQNMKDPLVNKMVEEAHDIYRGMLDYRHDAGMLTDQAYNALKAERRNFVPTQLDFGNAKKGFLDLFDTADEMFVKHQADFFKERKGLIPPGGGQKPSQLLESYIQQVVRSTESNRLRLQFLEAVDGSKALDGSVKKQGSSDLFSVTAIKNGKPVHYRVGDDAIRRALDFNPRFVIPYVNGARRIFQEMTTGLLNPLFVPVSWAYEAGSAILLRKPGQKIGFLPTAPVIGAARSSYEDMMFAMGRNMEVSLRTNGFISKMIGDGNTRSLARIGMRAYENGFNRIAEQYGAGNAVFSPSRTIESTSTMMDQVAPNFFAATEGKGFTQTQLRGVWSKYMHFMTNMHNGIRMQSLSKNVSPSLKAANLIVRNKVTRNKLTEAAANTRTLGGDTSQIAGGSKAGRITQGFVSSTPYSNVAMQIIAEHVRAAKQFPGKYIATFSSVVTSGAALMYGQFRTNEAARDHYFNKLTAEQRSANLPIYKPGTDEIVFNVPIEHIYRIVWSPVMEMLGSITGMKRELGPGQDQVADRSLREGMTAFLANDFSEKEATELTAGAIASGVAVLPDPVPTVLGIGAAATGQSLNFGRFAGGGSLRSEIRAENITSEQTSRVAGDVFTAEAEAIFNEMLGTGSQPLLQAMNAFVREFGDSDDWQRALGAAESRYLGAQADRTSPLVGLFDLETRITTNDANGRLFKSKMKGIDDIVRRFGLDFVNPGAESASIGRRLPSGIMPPEVRGTALAVVLTQSAGSMTSGMQDVTGEIRRQFKILADRRRDPDFAGSAKTLRHFENQITEKIKSEYAKGVERMQDREDSINEELHALGWDGRFRFQDFDADMAEELRQIKLQ